MSTRHAMLYCAVFLSLLVGTGRAGLLVDDFGDGINPDYWDVLQTSPGRYTVDDANGDVRLAWAGLSNVKTLEAVRLRLDLQTIGGAQTGDFVVSIAFEDAVLARTTGLNQVELHTTYQDGSIFFVVRDEDPVNTAHVWTGSRFGNVSATDSGVLSISRSGSALVGYYNSSVIFQTTKTSALTKVEFLLQNNLGSTDATSVTFDNFQFEGPGVVIPEPGSALAMLLAALVTLTRRPERRV